MEISFPRGTGLYYGSNAMTPAEKLRLKAKARARMAAELGVGNAPGGVAGNTRAINEFKDKSAALQLGAANMGTFGFGDNIAGARGALFGSTIDDQGNMARDMSGTMGERYARERDRVGGSNGDNAGTCWPTRTSGTAFQTGWATKNRPGHWREHTLISVSVRAQGQV